MVRRIGSLVALLLVATLVLAACGSPDEEVEPTVTRVAAEGAPQPTTPGEEASPTAETPADGGETAEAGQTGGEAVTIDVELVDILFEPDEITVPANTEVTVNLTNTGAAAHTFTIESLGVDSGELAAGESSSLTFNSGAAGEHEFICTVPGHKEAGMVGTLIVTEEAGGAASPAAGADATPAGSESPAAEIEATPAPEIADEATPGAATPASAAQTTFDVSMIDIAFEQTELTVPANSEITINLTNNGAAPHNFTIDELGVASGDYAAGQTGTVTFNSGAPGEYEFYCSVPGHKEAGMIGKLIVTAETGAAASPAAQESPVAETVASPAAPEQTADVTTEASPVASPAAETADSGAQTAFDVSMIDIAFEETELTVPANTEITINLTNNGVAPHNFTIDALGVASGDYAAGQTGTVTFNSGAPGEYEFYCSVPGHKEAGMVGKLVVVADEGGTAPPPAGSESSATPEGEASPAAAPDASPGASEAAAQTTFDVSMVDIAFEETEITVPANSEITINLVNNGVAPHNFTVDELGVASGDVAAGQSGTVTFNSGAPGEYEFYCSVPGHKEAGMVGKLIVTPATGETAPPVAVESEASPAATKTEGSPEASPAASPVASGGATTVDVSMIDIAFEETEITVPANAEITVNLTNNGVAAHNFTIDELGVASGDYAAGQTGSVTFNSGAPGEYEIYCSVPGHKEAGMVATLIVQ